MAYSEKEYNKLREHYRPINMEILARGEKKLFKVGYIHLDKKIIENLYILMALYISVFIFSLLAVLFFRNDVLSAIAIGLILDELFFNHWLRTFVRSQR